MYEKCICFTVSLYIWHERILFSYSNCRHLKTLFPLFTLQELIKTWDVAETDRLIAQYEADMAEKKASELAAAQKKLKGVADELESAKKDAEHYANALKKAHMELEKRIHEYDVSRMRFMLRLPPLPKAQCHSVFNFSCTLFFIHNMHI